MTYLLLFLFLISLSGWIITIAIHRHTGKKNLTAQEREVVVRILDQYANNSYKELEAVREAGFHVPRGSTAVEDIANKLSRG